MTSWKLNPGAINDVLARVQPSVEDLSRALDTQEFTDISTAIQGGGNGLMGEVPAAFNDVIEDQNANLSNLINRMYAGLIGVKSASAAYAAGQQAMADEIQTAEAESKIQTEMFKSSTSGDFSYFTGKGSEGGSEGVNHGQSAS